ncbi:hypothetical protein MNV_1210018 [Candidatus Methanoperedens nitroreducens]|uniref:Uncharacterized protein n=1 Tax=Candidatus Methanoperedens nitratireducens TaxID=1392998 RepID=A0A284VJU6_9EURY|nr:hypothetical protein MNV_1210018 [Candidatus Methanoperedens nitroreducens]
MMGTLLMQPNISFKAGDITLETKTSKQEA